MIMAVILSFHHWSELKSALCLCLVKSAIQIKLTWQWPVFRDLLIVKANTSLQERFLDYEVNGIIACKNCGQVRVLFTFLQKTFLHGGLNTKLPHTVLIKHSYCFFSLRIGGIWCFIKASSVLVSMSKTLWWFTTQRKRPTANGVRFRSSSVNLITLPMQCVSLKCLMIWTT